MALFGMGKRPKPMQFKYVPRHYDPLKDELDSRLGKGGGAEAAKSRISSGLRRGYGGTSIDTRSQKRQSFMRLLAIIAVLAMVVYVILASDVFLNFVESIEKIEKVG